MGFLPATSSLSHPIISLSLIDWAIIIILIVFILLIMLRKDIRKIPEKFEF